MKIDSSTTNNVSPLPGTDGARTPSSQATAAAASGTSPAAAGTADAAHGGVSLSDLSANLLSLGSSSNDDIDLPHVNAIRTALKDGTLQIDASKIADGVLKTARDLLKTPQQD